MRKQVQLREREPATQPSNKTPTNPGKHTSFVHTHLQKPPQPLFPRPSVGSYAEPQRILILIWQLNTCIDVERQVANRDSNICNSNIRDRASDKRRATTTQATATTQQQGQEHSYLCEVCGERSVVVPPLVQLPLVNMHCALCTHSYIIQLQHTTTLPSNCVCPTHIPVASAATRCSRSLGPLRCGITSSRSAHMEATGSSVQWGVGAPS